MNIDWIILNLECKTLENGLSNVVSRINIKLVATKTYNGEEYITQLIGPLDIPPPDNANFTPYESLTKEQVINWITNTIGEQPLQKIYDRLQNILNEQINPTIVSLEPPFEN
jgi:hypothetical protein